MNEDKQSTCSATLDLVCPPIANSVASKLVGDDYAERIIRQSDFYMIGGRPEAKFCEFKADPDTNSLSFSIEVAGGVKDYGWIRIDEIPYVRECSEDVDMYFKCGEFILQCFAQKSGEEELVAAFTPDDILMRRGRKEYVVGGLDSHLELATYDLLYVGIAKVGDSYDRLFANGHHARMQILADEPQRYPGARVSDETYLFLFRVEPLLIKVFGPESEIGDEDLNFGYDGKRLVADAEKAFVSLLKPKYNSKLYPNYPKGKDGLYQSGLTAYSYSISEGMAFRTQYGCIKGGRERDITMSNDADFILVRGDEVTFHISGIDFDVSQL